MCVLRVANIDMLLLPVLMPVTLACVVEAEDVYMQQGAYVQSAKGRGIWTMILSPAGMPACLPIPTLSPAKSVRINEHSQTCKVVLKSLPLAAGGSARICQGCCR